MINSAVAAVLFVALVITIFLGVFTLFYCKSAKRHFFILMTTSVFLFLLGYLLEVTALSADGGFAAVKVMYMGSAYVSPLFLLFVADFCNLRIRPIVVIPMMALSGLIILLIWTTDQHHLIYTSYGFCIDDPVHHLTPQYGPLYYLNHIYSMFCTVVSSGILVYHLRRGDSVLRPQLLLLLAGVLTPVLANLLFVLKIGPFGINYTPLSLAIVNALFYVNVMRYDLFDIMPLASELALTSIKEGFVLVDPAMRFLSANPAAQRVFPDLQGWRKGRKVLELGSWPQELTELDALSNAGNIPFSRYNGIERHYNASINPLMSNERLTGWVILLQDVSDSVDLMRRLEHAAYTDALTGIYNRRHFLELAQPMLDKALRISEGFYIVIFDIDHFKKVNDLYGHQAGDLVLKSIAFNVKGVVRPYDLFARYGGEEFILLLTGLDDITALHIAERLRGIVKKSLYVFEEQNITVTASFGVAASGVPHDLEKTIQRADRALYEAKNSGRNQVVFYAAE